MDLDVTAILFDWGGTLAGVTREVEHWPDCADRAAGAVFDTGDPRLDGAGHVLAQRFADALVAARRDPEHREIDSRRLLIEWGEQVGLGEAGDWPIDRALDAFWAEWVGILDRIDGAAETLGELKRRGYRIGLVSNVTAPPPYVDAELTRLGLRRWLDHCTLSSAVGHRKPHPAFYEAALAGIASSGEHPDPRRVLFVGDGPVHDVGEPQRQGMRTALVRYDGLPWPADQLRDARPDLRIDHVVELLHVLPERTTHRR